MAIYRHARRALRARSVTVVTTALLVAMLAAPATAASAVTPPSPASVSAPAALTSTPVLAAVSSKAAKRKAVWRRRRAAVRFARSQLGKPYRWGGSGPNGYDCSGLTLSAWKRGGKALPHSSRMQFNQTRRVQSRRKMRVGDLLFYGNPVHHVAIYVGNGKTIEAPRRGLNVRKASAKRAGLRKIGRP